MMFLCLCMIVRFFMNESYFAVTEFYMLMISYLKELIT